ncbi:MAG: hypothetical protein GX538_04855 [Gammaproteobacteria bacterium]|nr:hypothetical protein [Gammaproteobacteria bacterium]
MLLKWRFAWILALALLAGPAFALGLGQIQVRSQYGEPLLAEIPIVSSDPAELRQLQARLASPETFARIGLQPPQGLVQDLQFNVALDAAGRPVIRVTSTAPVEQPLLTFLIEADWGQGRLVREYSALVDAPDAIAAPAQPPIQAPEVDAGNRIVRPAPAPAAPDLALEPDGHEPAQPEAVPDPEPVAEAPVAAPRVTTAPVSASGDYGPVRAGDSLSRIVQDIARDEGVSANQMMLALLRTNPQAFIGGNINLLREGAILRIPDSAEAQQLTAAEATAEVRSQVARWREMTGARAQPGTGAAASADSIADADGAVAEPAPGADAATGGGSALADARLEIAPASAEGDRQAGTRSGITAGGEGEMLQQELQETRESLAARDAEVEELKSRLAELEQLQRQQQQLIELKDSELAAVQQRLAESNLEAAPTLAHANQDPAGGPEPEAAGLPWGWIGLGLVLLIAAGLAWVRTRREATNRGAGGAAPAVAASAQAGRSSPTWHAGGASAVPEREQAPDLPAPAPVPQQVPSPAAGDEVAPEPKRVQGALPADSQGDVVEADPSSRDAVAAATADDSAPAVVGDLLADAGERLELAKAYAELGDLETARALLEEVARETGTPEGSEAARLLSELA